MDGRILRLFACSMHVQQGTYRRRYGRGSMMDPFARADDVYGCAERWAMVFDPSPLMLTHAPFSRVTGPTRMVCAAVRANLRVVPLGLTQYWHRLYLQR